MTEAPGLLARLLVARAGELARIYPHVAPAFIRRLIASVAQSGCPLELAIRRYLDGDKTVEVPPELLACHQEALRERRFSCPAESSALFFERKGRDL